MTTKKQLPVVFDNKIYVPEKELDLEHIEKRFTHTLYVERKNCRECEYVVESPCDMCNQCPNFIGSYKLVTPVSIKGEDYLALPIGAKKDLVRAYPELKKLPIVDKRPVLHLSFAKKFKFTWDLYDYQVEATDAMLRVGYGVLNSPPRSGKTAMAVAMCVAKGLKTLVVASQTDWLEQFLETFHGATNILELEEVLGKKLCGIAKTDDDLENLEICLCTYQTFLSDSGRKRLKLINRNYSVMFLDEAHKSSASEYAKVISTLSIKYKYGLTGTPDRKDGKYILTQDILGPVMHTVHIESQIPSVRFTESKFTRTYKTWTPFIVALGKDKARNKLIVDMAEYYYNQGHSIVIPVFHVAQVDTLVQAINKRLKRKVAAPFTGKLSKVQRRDTVLAMRSRKLRILVGIRSITQTGLNIPVLSCLLEVAPISNVPAHTQEVARILTPMEGKLKPVIHYVVDPVGISIGCLRTCVLKGHKPAGHKISQANWDKLNAWFNTRKPRTDDDDTVKVERATHGRKPKGKTALTKAKTMFKKSGKSL